MPTSGSEERVLRVMRSSLLQFQQSRRLRELEQTLEEEEDRLAELPVGCLIGYENGEELLDEYERLGRIVEEARRREKKLEQNLSFLQSQSRGLPWQRPERDQIRRAFRTMPQGGIVHLENRGWAIYLGRGLGAVVGLFLELGPQGAEAGEQRSPLLGDVLALTEYRQINYLPVPQVSVPLPDALTTLAVPPTVPLEQLLAADELDGLKAEASERAGEVARPRGVDQGVQGHARRKEPRRDQTSADGASRGAATGARERRD